LNFVHGRRMKAFAGMVDLLFSKRAGDAEVDQHAVKMVFESLWAASKRMSQHLRYLPLSSVCRSWLLREPRTDSFPLSLLCGPPCTTERSTARKTNLVTFADRARRTARCRVHRRLA
jgi:hypothetical protein